MLVALVLSPHLDDAVFSCAGRILAEGRAGRRVVIATLFSHSGQQVKDRAKYRDRRREDRLAARLIGAEVVCLGLPDAPCRTDYYRSFRTIIFGEAPEENSWRAKIERRLSELVARLRPTRIYAPLGVGNHIDHRLTFEAAQRLKTKADVWYYEERPYALVPHATDWRLACIGYPPKVQILEIGRAYWRHLLRARYVRAYLSSERERERCRKALSDFRGRKGDIADRHVCSSVVFPISDQDIPLICQACFAYASQAPIFLGPQSSFARASRRHAGQLGSDAARVERLWKVAGPPTV